MSVKLISVIVSLFVFFVVIDLVRRERLTFKYAAGWLCGALIALGLAVFDNFVASLSAALGFTLPSNFIFFSALCGFVFLSILLTVFLCQQNKRNDLMAQKLGFLEAEIRELKKTAGDKP